MPFTPKELKIEAIAYQAALGAGVAYSMYGTDPVSLAIGGVAGYFAYPPLSDAGHSLSALPDIIKLSVPEIVAGALIGYNLYNGNLAYTAGGAAAGVAVKMAFGVVLAKEMGVPL